MNRQNLVIKHSFALGDTVLLTALVRDIQLQCPGQFNIMVDTHFRETWTNNPHATVLKGTPGRHTFVEIRYANGVKASGRGQKVHMLAWYHHDFNQKTGMQIFPTVPKGDLHLTEEESRPIVDGRYWVMMAGGKTDITCKWWHPSRWQQVADALAEKGITIVQAGANHREHRHPKLTGVVDMIGKLGSSREFFNLIQHADGVLSPVTAAMHIAAVYDKPCVALCGGREEPWWEAYVNCYQAFGSRCQPVKIEHRFLHTLGQLECCKTKGCYKHRTVPIHDGHKFDNSGYRCKLPVLAAGGSAVPRCLDLIQANHVVEAVMSYYQSKEIPPIGDPPITYEPIARRSHDEIEEPAGKVTVISPTKLPSRMPARQAIPGLVSPTKVTGDTPRFTIVNENSSKAPLTGQSFDQSVTALLRHPTLGGRMTVFVLCFGDHFDLAQGCLESIFNTIPLHCLDIRVGLNAVCPQTRAFINGMCPGRITRVYDEPSNIKKYPMMRKMFNDPSCPISTPYVVWLDDDAKVVSASMWSTLCGTIIANHPHGSRLYGNVFTHDARGGSSWFRQAAWWKNRNLRVRGQGMEAPNGSTIEFVAGWFWALHTRTIAEAGIPDQRLVHNGGDITIGEQVHQAGYKIKQLNRNKELVWCPSREAGGRRGYSEAFPWSRT